MGYLLDIGLESVNFARLVVFFEVLDHLFHVALQVIGERLLVRESGLNEPVIEDDVDAGLCSIFGSFVGFLGRSVGSGKNDLAVLAGLVLRNNNRKSSIREALTITSLKT